MITDKLSDFPWHLENNAGGKTSVLPHHFGQENLLDLAGIGLWLFDACGETTYVNNAIATRLGYSREELLALPMIALTGQEQLTEAMRLTRGQKQKTPEKHEARFFHRDGSEIWVNISSIPSFDAANTFLGMAWVLIDITESKRLQQEMARENELLNAIAANAEDVIYVKDREGRYLMVNQAGDRATGFSLDQVVGSAAVELAVAENRREIQRQDQEVLRTGNALTVEQSLMVEGQPRVFLTHKTPFRAKDGQITGIVGLTRDITRIKQTEQSLRESEERYRAILENIQDGYFECNLNGIYRWILDSGTPRFAPDGEFLGYIGSCFDITDRKEAEEALRQSEERYRTILENILDGYYEVDLAGRLTFVNDGLVRMFGLESKEKLLGANILKFADETHAHRLRETASQVRHTGQAVSSFVYELRQGNGIRRDVDISLSPIKNSSGRQTGFRGIIRDVTERKRAEDALLASEERFAKAFSASPEAMCLVTLEEGQFLYVNDAWIQSVGMKREDVIGRTTTELGLQRYPMPRQEFIEWLKREGHLHDLEVRTTQPSGQMRTQLFSYQLIELQGQQVILAVSKDITERKRMEDLLRMSEERFAKAFNASPQPMAILELPSRRYANVNHALVRSSGWAAEEIIGRTASELNVWVNQQDLEKVDNLLVNHGNVRNLEMKFRTKEGEIREFLYSAETISLENRPHILVVASDITDRLRAERALQESEERYRLLFEHGFAGISRSTLDGRMLECNDALAEIFGCQSREEVLQTYATDFYFDQAEREKLVDDLKRHGRLKNYERLMKRKDGSPVWTLANFSLHKRGPDGPQAEMVWDSIVLDITERKLIEQQLAQSNEQTRAFSARLETIREEERTRIAREIHDNLGQALTGLKLEFSWLDKNLTRATDESLRRKAIPKLKEIAQLLEETIQTVRHIATELRPGVLDTLGLSAAIDWQSREFIRRSGIQGEIRLCPEPSEFPPERATALFRIFQEILTNIARHSRASQFNVRMVQNDGDLILTVRDNGIGIAEAQLRDPKSLGLIGMRERVLIFGGSVLIEGQHAGRMRGTIINVKMPVTG